jgi:CBS domain containing-hemolysin-like protein
VNEELGLTLDEDVARTIGGLVFHTLGRVAQNGDAVEIAGLRLDVEEMLDNRIDVVRLTITGETPANIRESADE